jgi:hypothetical protein
MRVSRDFVFSIAFEQDANAVKPSAASLRKKLFRRVLQERRTSGRTPFQPVDDP